MLNLQFRSYLTQDLEACLAIFDRNCPKFFAAYERDGFSTFLQKERLPYFVVTDDGENVLACGGYIIEKDWGELAWGMVEAEFHKQGIGTFLFAKRLDEMRKAGATSVKMDTSQHSLNFYLRLGFRVVSTKPDGYGSGLDRIDLLLHL